MQATQKTIEKIKHHEEGVPCYTYAEIYRDTRGFAYPEALKISSVVVGDYTSNIGFIPHLKQYDQWPWCITSLTNAPRIEGKKNGFKFHIAINDPDNDHGIMDQNLERGYNIADEILRHNNVVKYKVVVPGVKLEEIAPDQARKQMTIYSGEETGRSPEEWELIMDEAVMSFIDNGIEPKPEFEGEQDVCVKGSAYITYRNDDDNKLERGRGLPYKHSYDLDPYQDLCLSDIIYKKIIDKIKDWKPGAIEIAEAIEKLVEASIEQGETRSNNIIRIFEHMKRNENFLKLSQVDQKNIRLVMMSMSLNRKKYIMYNIEALTSYSAASIKYNQKMLAKHRSEYGQNDDENLDGSIYLWKCRMNEQREKVQIELASTIEEMSTKNITSIAFKILENKIKSMQSFLDKTDPEGACNLASIYSPIEEDRRPQGQ